jgi:hypothetical protein
MKALILTLSLLFICTISFAQSTQAWRYADNHPYKRGMTPPTPYQAPITPRAAQHRPIPYYYPQYQYNNPYRYYQPHFGYGICNNNFYWYYRIR